MCEEPLQAYDPVMTRILYYCSLFVVISVVYHCTGIYAVAAQERQGGREQEWESCMMDSRQCWVQQVVLDPQLTLLPGDPSYSMGTTHVAMHGCGIMDVCWFCSERPVDQAMLRSMIVSIFPGCT